LLAYAYCSKLAAEATLINKALLIKPVLSKQARAPGGHSSPARGNALGVNAVHDLMPRKRTKARRGALSKEEPVANSLCNRPITRQVGQ
jgi:hypothetical protein